MKKLLFVAAILVFCSTIASAQKMSEKEKAEAAAAEDSLPYHKSPMLPSFSLQLLDSVSVFNTYTIPKGRVSVLMLFSPDCEHCQKLTEKLLKGMDSLQNLDFYLFTFSHLNELQKFYDKYHLADYKNIKVVGRDYSFYFSSFFGIKYVPFLAVYNKDHILMTKYADGVTVKELYIDSHL
jgi:thiol-disulfide isomerase/thioredoxin